MLVTGALFFFRLEIDDEKEKNLIRVIAEKRERYIAGTVNSMKHEQQS